MFALSDILEPPQAHAGPDLAHIQDMLSDGSVIPTSPPHSTGAGPSNRHKRASQSRVLRGGRGRQASAGATTGRDRVREESAAPSNQMHDSLAQPQLGRGQADGSANLAEGADHEPHNRPGPRSTGRRWHCEACDCFVGDTQWSGHVQGIRHRRHALSIREFGKRGGMVVSTFEAPSALETQRPKWRRAANAEPASIEGDSLLEEVRSTALKELVHHTGLTSGEYHRLGDRFSLHRLNQCWQDLTAAGGGKPLREVAGNESTQEGVLSMDVDAAMLACLAHALASGRLGVRELWLKVSSPCAKGLDAIASGLVLLMRALPTSHVSHLGIHIVASPGTFANAANNAMFKMPKVRQATLACLQRCVSLRVLTWKLPIPMVDSRQLLDWSQKEEQTLQQTLFEAKNALLMALHPRMNGRCGLLSSIPLDCLHIIFDKAFGGGSLKVTCCTSQRPTQPES